MDENFLNVLYIEHTDKIGVLKDDKDERVSIILGTDKTLVERKREGKTYLLVPLTKNHTFVCKGNSIDVDGEHIKSEIFFRKDGAQQAFRLFEQAHEHVDRGDFLVVMEGGNLLGRLEGFHDFLCIFFVSHK